MRDARIARFGWALILVCALTGAIARGDTPPVKKVPYAKSVQVRVDAALDDLQAGKEPGDALKTLQAVFDEAARYAPDDHPDALREAAFALRLAEQLNTVPPAERVELLKYLRTNPNLAQAMAFLIAPGQDATGCYKVLDALRAERGEQLDKYASLTAAICVVHHKPFERHVNENTAKSAEPLAIFDYYVKNESRMFFGIRNVPAELLLYVVDTTAGIEEMNWALAKYGGNKDVGKLFFDVPYDYDNFRKGTAKKITLLGFTLPNILQYGGVCADQAYFATQVGKAIGVPTAYDSGASAEVSHAWVGFLQTDGRAGWWNFDSGRYEAYRGVRGNVSDPHTRKGMPDSYVSLLGELIGTKPVDRFNAVALTDAAQRLIELEKAPGDGDAAAPQDVTSIRPKPRVAAAADELALVDAALHQAPGYAPAWFTVRDLATDNKLSRADKDHWFGVLMRLGAKRYPDFTLAVIAPMVSTIPDPAEQDKVWNNALFPMFQTRFDLAASIRMSQAKMWEACDQPDKAGRCYLDVVDRYANAGPFIIEALKGAEKLLASTNRADKVVALYQQTWEKTKRPQEMAGTFMTQSNWYRVGKLYAKKLGEAGNEVTAKVVEAKLDAVTGVGAAQ